MTAPAHIAITRTAVAAEFAPRLKARNDPHVPAVITPDAIVFSQFADKRRRSSLFPIGAAPLLSSTIISLFSYIMEQDYEAECLGYRCAAGCRLSRL